MKHVRGLEIKNDILKILREYHPDFVSGEKMSVEFGLSRAGLWKHIERLRKEGYIIESFPRKGYRVKKVPDKLTCEGIFSNLVTSVLGRPGIYCFESLTSTNERACAMASEGAEEGIIVTAETQTKGRGRMGRVWASPPGGLYFSVILRPEIRIDEIPAVTLAVASSVARSIERSCHCRTRVKWPNDILVDGKKVCGILAETRAHPDRTDFLVLGVGINVNTDAEKLPPEATGMKVETGTALDRSKFLGRVLSDIEKSYLIFISEGFRAFRDEAREMSSVIGKKVRIETYKNVVVGVAIDIDDRGALMVRDNEGIVHRVFSGDVALPANS